MFIFVVVCLQHTVWKSLESFTQLQFNLFSLVFNFHLGFFHILLRPGPVPWPSSCAHSLTTCQVKRGQFWIDIPGTTWTAYYSPPNHIKWGLDIVNEHALQRKIHPSIAARIALYAVGWNFDCASRACGSRFSHWKIICICRLECPLLAWRLS